jgi:hypothetical protein
MVSTDGLKPRKGQSINTRAMRVERKREPDPLGCLAPSLCRTRLRTDFHMDPSAGDWFQAERVSGSRSQLKGNYSRLKTPPLVQFSFGKTSMQVWPLVACVRISSYPRMATIGVHMALYRMLSELLESHTQTP